MNPIAADHSSDETQDPIVRCATADHGSGEIHGRIVGRSLFAADHQCIETQSGDIRCRRQATSELKPACEVPAAPLLSMGPTLSETHPMGAHRTTADQSTRETQHHGVGRPVAAPEPTSR